MKRLLLGGLALVAACLAFAFPVAAAPLELVLKPDAAIILDATGHAVVGAPAVVDVAEVCVLPSPPSKVPRKAVAELSTRHKIDLVIALTDAADLPANAPRRYDPGWHV